MTFDQIVEAALSRAMDFGQDFPTTRRVMYRRIEIREQEIFSLAARVNPDYFGVNAEGFLDSLGDVDLRTLDLVGSAIDPTSSVTRVEIQQPGTHPSLVCGQEVSLVTPNDREAALPPRMWLRNFTLHAVPGDMVGVVSVCIYYAYRPAPRTLPMTGAESSELPSVYQELLVLDLTKWLLKQSISMSTEIKVAATEILNAEEQAMVGTFSQEIQDYAGAQVSRFGSVVGGQRV